MEALKSLADLEENPFPDGQCRLILVGKTGNGKSSTGNSILGWKAFKPQTGINSETEEGALESVMKDGLEIQVMDTPGLHDTEVGESVIAERITRSLLAINPGPHVIILCLSCAQRFTEEEVLVLDGLKRIFGEMMTSYLVVVLVKRDVLENDGVNFEQQLQKSSKLKKLLVEANNRYILFDNRSQLSEEKKREQVDQLLAKVREVVVENGGYCFRHTLSERLDDTMDIMKKAELKAHDPDPAASDLDSQDVKPPKPKTRTFDAQEKEESTAQDGSGKSMRKQSLQCLEEMKTVTKLLKQIEHITQKFPQVPPDPSRMRVEAAEDKGTKWVPELLPNLEVKSPNEETRPAGDDDTTTPASFAYQVPDRPGMRMRDKQRMAEEALKWKLARGTEELNEEQIEELEKITNVTWEQFQQNMSETALKSINQCRLM